MAMMLFHSRTVVAAQRSGQPLQLGNRTLRKVNTIKKKHIKYKLKIFIFKKKKKYINNCNQFYVFQRSLFIFGAGQG